MHKLVLYSIYQWHKETVVGYRKDVWQLPLDGDFDAHSSQLNDVDVRVSEEK
jgi:hypothetical protein